MARSPVPRKVTRKGPGPCAPHDTTLPSCGRPGPLATADPTTEKLRQSATSPPPRAAHSLSGCFRRVLLRPFAAPPTARWATRPASEMTRGPRACISHKRPGRWQPPKPHQSRGQWLWTRCRAFSCRGTQGTELGRSSRLVRGRNPDWGGGCWDPGRRSAASRGSDSEALQGGSAGQSRGRPEPSCCCHHRLSLPQVRVTTRGSLKRRRERRLRFTGTQRQGRRAVLCRLHIRYLISPRREGSNVPSPR